MAPFGSLLMLFFVVYFTSLGLASPAVVVHVQFSGISAAPAVLPGSPLASPPGLSPDIEPLFPTPVSPPPSESSLPIIPSSPSPPNPDNILAPGPELGAFPPSRALPVSSSVSLTSSGPVNLIFFVGFLYFCLIHLSGM